MLLSLLLCCCCCCHCCCFVLVVVGATVAVTVVAVAAIVVAVIAIVVIASTGDRISVAVECDLQDPQSTTAATDQTLPQSVALSETTISSASLVLFSSSPSPTLPQSHRMSAVVVFVCLFVCVCLFFCLFVCLFVCLLWVSHNK